MRRRHKGIVLPFVLVVLAASLIPLSGCHTSAPRSTPPPPVAPPKAQRERLPPPPPAKKKRHAAKPTPGSHPVALGVLRDGRRNAARAFAPTGRVVPRIVPGIPRSGPLFASPNKAVIRRVLRRHITPAARLCYAMAVKRKGPRFQGRMLVRFSINPRGRVSSAKMAQSIGDATMDRCVAKAFLSTRFPRLQGGLVIVNYPLVFHP